MDYFHLDRNNIEEYIFDMSRIKNVFETESQGFLGNMNLGKACLGNCRLKIKKKGSIYLLNYQLETKENILFKSSEGVENIGVFFRKKGNPTYSFDQANNVKHSFAANSTGMYFMHEDYCDNDLHLKNNRQDSVSLHLPIWYFERLVNQYPDLFEKAFRRFQRGESFFLQEHFAQISPELNQVLRQLENADLMGTSANAYIDAKVLEILSYQFNAVSLPHEENLKNSEYDKIREAAHILLTDIHNPPSLKALSLQVGINEKKLKNGFKAVFDNTVYGHLFDYKMQLAGQLLRDTNKSITEVAMQCGYNYPSHFCTAFKRKFGITPNKIRK